ncbi:MAG: LysR family transcriptional regulator [Betaproteobacteria bacterium]|nr:LysR family transcriptional regulator [Betaproteobacteria bacterium]
MIALKTTFRILIGPAIAIGPGKADLLEGIGRTGSISAAARAMNMSYRRAWLLVDTMNRCFKQPLVAAQTGGKGGGGAQITDLGREILHHYREMERKTLSATGEDMAAIRSHLTDTPPENPH